MVYGGFTEKTFQRVYPANPDVYRRISELIYRATEPVSEVTLAVQSQGASGENESDEQNDPCTELHKRSSNVTHGL